MSRWGTVGSVSMAALTCLLMMAFAGNAAAAANPCGPPVTSVIACENSQPGDPPSDWQISGDGDTTIRGYATSMSVNRGQTISFKISTPASSYHIDILRLGYYQGNGARKVASNLRPTATLPQSQPACLSNSTTGLIDCGNWGVSASWTVPSTAVSGLYIAHLVRDDTGGGGSQIPFVVRDDSSHSDIVYQTSDPTWEAYNTYGGNSLYTCTVACPPGNPLAYKAAYKVSYNRPFTFTADQGRASPYYAEYPMIRFLEANGYDVSYVSGQDVDRSGPLLLNHKIFISSGHDEYWSGAQRANVEAARDAGVNLAFFSGNEIFWKTRWESSIDGSSTPYRTLVTYKETHFDAPTDPQDPPTWTGSWRDPRFSPPGDARAENALSGQFFIVNSGTSDIQVPYAYSRLRLWRNTAVASLGPGQTATLGSGIGTLGYEWDEDPDNGYRPAGEFDLSSTTRSGVEVFSDYGSTTATGTATHHLSLYRAPSGALVFGAGTVQWSWGLDSTNNSVKPPDPTMQQATVNLFADMGAQPYALLSGLAPASASADTTPPTSTITSPTSGANVQNGASVTITGTASDGGGGVVAGVEVSTDNGVTWHPATGTTNWSYTWFANRSPSTRILSRAVDDSGNLETPASGTSVNVSCNCSIFGSAVPTTPDSGDKSSIEVGVKFRSDVFGTVSGVRFYKSAANTGTHVGSLWTTSGQLLARATFSGESASGWQQVNFSSAVPINPNTTYVASYYAPASHYPAGEGYFYPPPSPEPDGNGVVDSPPLHALRTGPAGGNGVFSYTTSPTFPTSSFNAENYWVDVSFTPQPAPGQVTGVNATAGYKSALVTWTAPTTGGPTTTYTITPYIGSAPQSPTTVNGSPAQTSTTVTGLTNGTTYTFVVTASNPSGAGPQSADSNAVTPSSTASVVINGGFESGLSGWTTGGLTSPVASTAKVHNGTGSAQLGVLSGPEPTGDSSLSQTLTVPPGTSTLTFWYWPATTDSTCSGASCQYDWQEAQVRNTSGQTLASIFKSNSNAQAWTPVTFDTSTYAGQTIVLWFNVHEDGSTPPDDTSMYLDDVALNASGPTAPGQPTNVSATAGNGSATVSWTAPSTGGSPITSYTVTPYIGSSAQAPTTITGSPPATTANITGLTNGTAYTFTVAATNAIGTGVPSNPSNAVTPTAPTPPGAPTNVNATAGNGSATVSWTAPSTGGSPITSYKITPYVGSVAQTATTITGAPPATTATITGLTRGTSYTFTVTAVNSVGPGQESSQSNAVTPSDAAPAFVQQVSTHKVNAASATVTPTSIITAGNRIVVLVGVWKSAAATAKTVADSAGNHYSELLHFTASDNTEESVWSAPITAGGGTKPTITVTASASADVGVVALEYSGLSSVSDATVVDQTAHATGTTSSAGPVASGATPASSAGNELALGMYTDSGFSDSLTSASGWTSRANVSPSGDIEMLAQDQIVPAGASPNATVGTGARTVWLMATVVLKSGAAPSPSAPGAPTGVSATAGNGSATVSWSAPSNGGSQITSYTITPLIGSTSQTPTTISGSPPATTATVNGLTNGTDYTFTVTATNNVGTGPPSSASNSVTPSASSVVPAFVQGTSNHAGSGTSISATPASSITSGDRLVVVVGVWGNSSPAASGVTDAAGNHYTEVQHFTASDDTELSVWTAPITAGGGTRPSITATASANADFGIVALEYSGLSPVNDASVVDQAAHSSGKTSVAASVSSGATAHPAAANELALGLYVDSGFGNTLTPGSVFTSRANVSPASDIELLAEDQIAGQGATPSASAGTGANTIWLMSTLLFKHS